MTYNENIKIGELLNDEKAVAILAKHLPEFINAPTFKMASNFTLNQLVAIPQVDIPEATLKALKIDLAEITLVSEENVKNKPVMSSQKNDSLVGKVITVTGAGSGIGRASAILMAARGAKLVLVDFNASTGLETLELIKEQNGEAIFVQADVSSNNDVQNYIQKAVETYRKIDVAFNNAGIMQQFQRFQDISEEEFTQVINVNLKGIFLGMKYALQVMDKQGYGHVINTASTTAIRAEHSLAAYTASKHGVAGLTKAAALEYVRKGIRVNAICPGGVATTMTDAAPQMLQDGGYMPEEFPNMRIGRFAQPQELAELVAFLASDGSSYMTGSIILADGGLTL
ncbi:NAD(P)-dependent dehydrogenase, short-chain alcohol dehydrogenase family [Paenibacillus sp. OK003]|uniref:NAD(P)-dependent dehydrogenase (Short-subunit alcohol dehydrogenase family) n=2 Tax=Paenibacillus TaxID=44249 RepID=A0A855XWG5_9BACL|nr:NAD(P)-dependent dehydrogenase (short-subunit alcohol dehydrogenase family) [Paenibacillus pabuli]PXW06058.1 NAD(P)-dependent dehydrogenase (short-subunit alcohol dehydrogenase family) [Paenibacillus taichungensis]SEK62207.1 NAD(P)-dependent dehydrogenase, short-chain alcohol dehydrogenase family [Paenibacillus sp. OK003]